MIIKKFNIKEEYTEYVYPEGIDDKIKKFNADSHIIYYIASLNDKSIFERVSRTSLDEALDLLIKLSNQFPNDNYCIFEGRFKALQKEDIDIYISSKKYNL